MSTLDPSSVAALATEHFGVPTVVTSCERGPVGNGQETWFVEAASDEVHRSLVLRRTAPGGPLEWTDREAEFRTLERAAAAGLPVPTVYWSDPTGGPLGHPYFVMERLPGKAVWRESPDTLERIAAGLGTWLAKLHASAIDEGALSSEAATRAEIARWRERYLAKRAGSVPALGALLAWLERETPVTNRAAVRLWGDPGPYNVLHEDGRITALLDWELSHVGDPLEDVGAAVWSCHDVLDRDRVVTAYELEAGVAVDRDAVRYFEVMACVTRSIMLTNAVANYVAGATAAPNLAGLGLHLVAANVSRALLLLGHEPAVAAVVDGELEPRERLRPDVAELLSGVASFLGSDVLAAAGDRVVRRGLKTAVALLETAAVRHRIEPVVEAHRAEAADRLLQRLRAAGIDQRGDLEAAIAEVIAEDRHAALRPAVWDHLVNDLRLTGALIGPLRELYGE